MKDIFLLDMDDTLLDFGRAEQENLRRTFENAGMVLTDALYRRFHAINDSLWKRLEEGKITREEIKTERFVRLFKEFGIGADAAAAARDYFEGFPGICFPYAGAAEFLAALSARGRVYIVTNGGSLIQRRHIALAGFESYLSGVFISEEMGADKSSAAYGKAVASRIQGFQSNRAVYIGDSMTSDMVCAERMGVDFILYGDPPEGYAGKYARTYPEVLKQI